MMVFPFGLISQVDSVLLEPAEVTSVQYQLNPSSTAKDILNDNPKVVLKDYGPASISTISMRGGNASQVQVSWNGVELNSPMLGLVDLSLVNTNLLNQITISSSLRDFSGITGGLNLESKSLENLDPNLQVELGMRVKSFNSNDYSFKTSFSKKRYGLSVSAIATRALNDYKYPLGSENRQFGESEVKRTGLMLSQFLNTKKIGGFELHVWAQNSFNEIPPTVVQSSSSAFQYDRFLRTQLHHESKFGKIQFRSVFSHALNENDYTDSLNLVFAENRFSRLHGQTEISRLSKGWSQKLKLSVEDIKAVSKSFDEEKSREIYSVNYSLAKIFKKNKFQFNSKVSLIDGQLFTAYQLFADVYLMHDFFIFGGISQSFRAPTLNDLYWNPGGNSDLVPEQAQAAELGLKKLVVKTKTQASLEITAFSRNTKNWMLWAFNSELNYWSAANINKVNTSGLESQLKLRSQFSESSAIKLSLGGQYVSSIFLESLSLPNIEEGSQLYYVPNVSLNGELSWEFNELEFFYTVNHRSSQEGVLYTLSEFIVQDASVAQKIATKIAKLTLRINAKNIFNTRYEMVEYRPLPGRYFEIEINLKSN